MMFLSITDLISSIVDISGNPIVDTVLFAIIGVISFSIAFGLVGAIFDAIGLYDSDVMSDVHWIIRIIVFAGLTWLFVGIFKLVAWLLSFDWWIYLIVVAVIILVVFCIYYIKFKRRKRLNSKNIADSIQISEENVVVSESQKSEPEPKKIMITSYSRGKCPRCGSTLVNRHGPYGGFIGCSSYPKCNYRRRSM